MADNFQVSPEMRQHLKDNGDSPAGDEVYRYQDDRVKISECPGGKANYTYNSQSNLTYLSPK